jgi:hypothetical protein
METTAHECFIASGQAGGSINSTILRRVAAFGRRPRPASRLSAMYSGLSVPGITALTATRGDLTREMMADQIALID